jgi:polyferredoxin
MVSAASAGVMTAGIILFVALFASSLVFGRLWCGFFCPFGAIQEFSSYVFDKPAKGEKYDNIKYLFFILFFAVVFLAAYSAGGFSHIDLFYDPPGGPEPYVLYYLFVGVFAALPMLFGRRAGCHYVCWMVPFMMLGRRIRNLVGLPALKLEADGERCGHCLLCKNACSMSLDIYSRVQAGSMEHPECLLCGRCVHNCPQRVIKYAFNSRK